MLVALNIVVLVAIVLLLVGEEWRFRRFSARVSATREALLLLTHKLRSPLAGLRKYHVFLQHQDFGSLSIAQQEAISRGDAFLGETIVLLGKLLKQARLSEAELSSGPQDVNASVRTVVESLREMASGKKHVVSVKEDPDQPKVNADLLDLHGIFDELFTNAISYTPPRGRISVDIRHTRSDVFVSISDNGIGVIPRERRYLFEKFFRGERARSMAPGNGLGTTFAKRFAQQMGGDVRYVPGKKRGSTFVVRIPLLKNI